MISSVIPSLFRLLNFGIIAAAGVYMYRRFGRELLQGMFEHYEKHKRSLHDEIVSLDAQAQEIKEAFEAQRVLGIRLAKNIEQWQQSVFQAIALRQHEKEALTNILQRKAERVARHTAWISLRRECLDAAVKEATQSLATFYADQAHAQAYLGGVISRLNECSLGELSLKERV